MNQQEYESVVNNMRMTVRGLGLTGCLEYIDVCNRHYRLIVFHELNAKAPHGRQTFQGVQQE